MSFASTAFYLLWENLLFFTGATLFFAVVGLGWKSAKPFELPTPFPPWFKIWFLSVQLLGGMLPIVVIFLWGIWWHYQQVLIVFGAYLIMLGLQIVSEIVSLRVFHSVVWVMVPYLYVPYRIWQVYEGLRLFDFNGELIWMRYLLILEIVVWIGNYCLDLSQLPFLLRWEVKGETKKSESQPSSTT
jgi:hypothetical protein